MKNTMNWKIAVGAAVLAVSALAAFAQSDAPPPGAQPQNQMRRGFGPDREVENLTRVLTLTPDQQKGVRAILEQQSQQMRALRNKTTTDAAASDTPDARRAQMEQIVDESNTKITALLDDEQKPKFAEWVQHRKAEMARRGQPAPQGAEQPQSNPQP